VRPFQPDYHNKDLAREHLESIRWPYGPICPHCGVLDNAVLLCGTSHRPGLYKCRDCRKQFSVTVGTVFERSKIPLNKWLLATHLLTASKKGISSHQIHRSLGVTYKTAWFMTHRIRKAMESTDTTPMGSGGGIVESDETYIGRKKGAPIRGGWGHKQAVLSLVERGGKVRSKVISGRAFDTIKDFLPKNIAPDANLMTDTLAAYSNIGKTFASHETASRSL
jgi:transposase-like protein